jgi:soluble lytic murein transglycosylase-like protein
MGPLPASSFGRSLRLTAVTAAVFFVIGLKLPAMAATARPVIDTDAARLIELGQFFETVEEPSRDLSKALDLYCRAAAAAHPEALTRLGLLYARGMGVEANDAIATTLFRWAAAISSDHGRAPADIGRTPANVGDAPATADAGWPDTPPSCLTRYGADSLALLRITRAAVIRAPAATLDVPTESEEPTPVVENPAQFRTGPPPAAHQRLVQMVVREAGRFKLDPRLVVAVMQTESSFDARARSSKNAQGLMQLIPDTARRFNVRNPDDPRENLRGGMAYLRWLLDYYHGDVVLALAAYNSGEGSVDRHRGVPPFRETIAYVQRIRALYPFDRHPFEANRPATGDRAWVVDGLAAAGLPVLSQAN